MSVSNQGVVTPKDREPLTVIIGHRIREARERAGMNQKAFAAACAGAFSYQQWGKLERGEQPIDARHIELAADALGVAPRDLLPGEKLPRPEPPPSPELSQFEGELLTVLRTHGRKAAVLMLLGDLEEKKHP